MTVIARDAVAADHLVYAWPFPLGPDCEVSCGEDEQVVMCPAWVVGDRLGPGHHVWRTPDPSRPVSAFFVRLAPVGCTFDMSTGFMLPTTRLPIRLRATGSLQVRCSDPGLLIAQFVGLPFDSVNDGVLRSVSRSVERMLARLLTRRVVMAGSPAAVTDPAMLPSILEELVAYNPTAGAVFGIELMSIDELVIGADDGSAPFVVLPPRDYGTAIGQDSGVAMNHVATNATRSSQPEISLTETAPGRRSKAPTQRHASVPPASASISGEIPVRATPPPASISGEIPVRATPPPTSVSGEIPVRATPPPIPAAAKRPSANRIEVTPPDEQTEPGTGTPVPGTLRAKRAGTEPGAGAGAGEARGAILGIGMAPIGGEIATGSVVAGEIPTKIAPGGRVLVPGPNGLMQSATVRQLLQGYYELEVGHTGETIWVPAAGVVPEA